MRLLAALVGPFARLTAANSNQPRVVPAGPHLRSYDLIVRIGGDEFCA